MSLLQTSAWAQETGSATGTITDATGGVLPGVTIELEPAGSPKPLQTVTDGAGSYRFDNVPPGPAELTIRLINFSMVRRTVNVTAGTTVQANVVMLVATSADIVVTAPRTFRNLAEIENPAENLVGVASAASEGAITAAQLAVRPVNRATEVLETVPGLVISQHSGEGKANQYYLRGFNLDHGFDFAQTIAGLPVNMPTHAHAQGYADSNFLIPELVSGVQFRKGPYYAENGDFSSAGSANINYFNVLERPIVTTTAGSFDYFRFLAAASPKVGSGNLLTAFEWERDNGPWISPNGKDKFNGVVRYTQGNSRNGVSLTFLGFRNHWHSTDQIPQRAVDSGQIDRFGFIEETDGGETYRYAGIFDWQQSGANNSTRLTGYVQRYGVQLFHNFTYFLNDPENGDQFEQFENRWTTGAKLTHRRLMHFGEKHVESAFGVDLRKDSVGGRSDCTQRGARNGSQPYVPTMSTRRRSVSLATPRSSGTAGPARRLDSAGTFTTGTSLPTIHSTPGRTPQEFSVPRYRVSSVHGRAPSSMPTGDGDSIPTRAWEWCCRSIRRRAIRQRPRRLSRARRGPSSASATWPCANCKRPRRSGTSTSTRS